VKLELQRRPGDDVRALWLLAAFIAGFGWYWIDARFERAIAAAHENSESLYRRTVSNERIVQQAATLSRWQNAALADLKRVSHETSLSVTTAVLVTTLDKSAKRYDTQITDVEPAAAAAKPAASFARDGALSETALTIKARGRFGNLLQFVEDLSHHRTLISVNDTQLTVASGEADRRQPKLDATIHAMLYRLRMASSKWEAGSASNR